MNFSISIIFGILLSLVSIVNCLPVPLNIRVLETSVEAAISEENYNFFDEYFKNAGFMSLY
ncbi:unnamed protein product [Acanthoscelides obtectus]|uniref:Uncharacterized protein n=1 Tax=Acanthoscelides obtectus TaxID=200917 RepID=A0A9P0K5T3_ACAOB|nr:unnamed protein product [Acanthoscelides obtectus]CAK1631057.1 hypothetical protein AOBTE_LOCUS6732 [Acanthoscelides obtectus]